MGQNETLPIQTLNKVAKEVIRVEGKIDKREFFGLKHENSKDALRTELTTEESKLEKQAHDVEDWRKAGKCEDFEYRYFATRHQEVSDAISEARTKVDERKETFVDKAIIAWTSAGKPIPKLPAPK